MTENYYAVIMAGGGGTRLWPLSRKTRPKQMLRLFDERSLFQIAVDRLAGVFPPERILVVTIQEQVEMLQGECPQIPGENYIIEPLPRGTASVIGLAAIVLQERAPGAVMAVLTADHFIKDEDQFREVLHLAEDVARDGYLVTMGIEPTYPSTGFGYIQRDDKLGHYHGHVVYRVARFKEKPNKVRAEELYASKDHYWNSGMFFWRVDRVLHEFEQQMPELHGTLTLIAESLGTHEEQDVLRHLWPQIEPETIDYGIMENAERVAVIPASNLGWSDVGSWDSLFDFLEGDVQGNIYMGKGHIGLDTKDSLIYAGEDDRLIVTIGVENLVVVDTGDVVLVCSRMQAQRVRQIVEQLRAEGQEFV